MVDQLRMKQRVLVSGATGYIGSQLVSKLLADQYEVSVLVREESQLALLGPVSQEITVLCHDGSTEGMIKLIENAAPSTIFHLASLFLAQHRPEDIEYLVRSNVLFSAQLIEAAALAQVPYFVNTGTSWQHYIGNEYLPVNFYAATKQAFENILDFYVDAFPIKATTLYLFDTYGPGDPRRKLIPLLINLADSQQPLDMSPGEQKIDLVYISDVIEAFCAAAAQLPSQVERHTRYAVASGKPISLKALVGLVESKCRVSLPINWGGRAYREREVMSPWADYEAVPGWKAEVSLEEGLARVFCDGQ